MNRHLPGNITKLKIEQSIEGVRVGQIIDINANGKVLVDYPGNTRGPVSARFTRSVDIDSLKLAEKNSVQILLVFENNNPELPIIIDILSSLIDEITTLETNKPDDIIVDGRRMIFKAEKEIILRCGKGKIVISADGRVVIKGTSLVSCSSGRNKIKGGSVMIN
ncbi:MAG: hypothetical protein GY737_06025 [Desulfobacteraceae bacterium]|nr:hypothetical protein [Desulfobacteraceae bacterium]